MLQLYGNTMEPLFGGSTIYYSVIKKTGHSILADNFARCWSIFKILSLSD